MNNNNVSRFLIQNAKTGAVLRDANDAEILAFGLGQTHPMWHRGEACFDHPVLVSGGAESVFWRYAQVVNRPNMAIDWL
jgi:hypothetical protein